MRNTRCTIQHPSDGLYPDAANPYRFREIHAIRLSDNGRAARLRPRARAAFHHQEAERHQTAREHGEHQVKQQ